MTTVDLYFDVSCVHSYIGFRQLRRALTVIRSDLSDVIVHLLPLLVAPEAPIGDYEPIQDVHRRDLGPAWRSMEEAMAKRGAIAGAPINFSRTKFTSTIPAHAAIQLVQAQDPRGAEGLVDELFHAYFMEGAMISDLDWLAGFCSRLGYVTPTLTSTEGEKVRKQVRHAHIKRITSAPTLMFPDGYKLTGAQGREGYAAALRDHI